MECEPHNIALKCSFVTCISSGASRNIILLHHNLLRSREGRMASQGLEIGAQMGISQYQMSCNKKSQSKEPGFQTWRNRAFNPPLCPMSRSKKSKIMLRKVL
jgi:hypothetical protein